MEQRENRRRGPRIWPLHNALAVHYATGAEDREYFRFRESRRRAPPSIRQSDGCSAHTHRADGHWRRTDRRVHSAHTLRGRSRGERLDIGSTFTIHGWNLRSPTFTAPPLALSTDPLAALPPPVPSDPCVCTTDSDFVIGAGGELSSGELSSGDVRRLSSGELFQPTTASRAVTSRECGLYASRMRREYRVNVTDYVIAATSACPAEQTHHIGEVACRAAAVRLGLSFEHLTASENLYQRGCMIGLADDGSDVVRFYGTIGVTELSVCDGRCVCLPVYGACSVVDETTVAYDSAPGCADPSTCVRSTHVDQSEKIRQPERASLVSVPVVVFPEKDTDFNLVHWEVRCPVSNFHIRHDDWAGRRMPVYSQAAELVVGDVCEIHHSSGGTGGGLMFGQQRVTDTRLTNVTVVAPPSDRIPYALELYGSHTFYNNFPLTAVVRCDGDVVNVVPMEEYTERESDQRLADPYFSSTVIGSETIYSKQGGSGCPQWLLREVCANSSS